MFHIKKFKKLLYSYLCAMVFTNLLLNWHKINERDLPWKKNKDPYFIWVSEIILQQTRVKQGIVYYKKFLEEFPTIYHLASAKEEEVLKVWQGLGYYSRARNMHKTAKKIVLQYQGSFPANTSSLEKLDGIGAYTAAAIGSFAFDLPVVALEGNGFRILSRYFNIDKPLGTTEALRTFRKVADYWLPKENSASFNQALMDFGSLVCTPKPKCEGCPLAKTCLAFQKNLTDKLPVRQVKKKPQNRYFHYFDFMLDNTTFIRRRKKGDIWKGLYEFPLIETTSPATFDRLCRTEAFKNLSLSEKFVPELTCVMPPHKLSHRTIHAVFYRIALKASTPVLEQEYTQIERKDLSRYAISKLTDNYLVFFHNFTGS